jgi:hypothetical protein
VFNILLYDINILKFATLNNVTISIKIPKYITIRLTITNNDTSSFKKLLISKTRNTKKIK